MEPAAPNPQHPVLIDKAKHILRAKHERPEWLTWAAELAGHLYLAETEEQHAEHGVPPVTSGLKRSDWCRRCNVRRPCGPIARARELARIGGHGHHSHTAEGAR
ncbi:hypothetical protein Afil01_29850 [Actinorhabdospora filicis]|uniref:Uncharacterized protein n=1 Tax=Actinorhabdospora filicis TaxID=1785913 RepID=A0A9W6SLH0_9ACTN|nr:hypothetical protein [Actinorhabdospora filicis]GLZ78178.1 hypothetical protein Afil01_29850 [Actinorhabdospora filicis]